MTTKGYTHLENTKRRISESMMGHKHSKETIEKIRQSNLGKKRSEETKRNISLSNLGHIKPINAYSFPKGIQMRKGLTSPMKGKKHKKESIEKLRKSCKLMWKKEGSIFQNREWLENRAKKVIAGLMKRPTSFEQKISNLCFKYNLPFVYKGDGNFLINFKNPDFVNEKDKVVIEVFYSYFKIRDYGSVENYKEFCKEKYNSAGWRVIFIDENDLNCEDWENVCLNKINSMEVLQ